MNAVQLRNIDDFVNSFELADSLGGQTFLITGATGLIGSSLIHCLVALKRNIKIIAPVRNLSKAQELFPEPSDFLHFIECDISNFNYDSLGTIDYVIHCAAPTSSKFFVEKPVETFNIIYRCSANLLEFSRRNSIKGMVFLSSLEVYGTILDDSSYITEDVQGYLDPMSVRSSYPMAKRATENLCHLYAKEYGLPVKVARLTQTTGAGIAKDDNRIIAQFARLAAQKQNIILHSTGESARPYCYLTDCISALLYILLKGTSGEAYNVANEETYISAKGMAEYLKKNFSPEIQVIININENMGYAPTTKQKLSSAKLQALGWKPKFGLNEIFSDLIEYIQSA